MEKKRSQSKARSRSQSASRVSTTGRAGQIEDEDEKSIREAQNHYNPEWELPLVGIKSIINNVEGHSRYIFRNKFILIIFMIAFQGRL